jgi:hypothetical protein
MCRSSSSGDRELSSSRSSGEGGEELMIGQNTCTCTNSSIFLCGCKYVKGRSNKMRIFFICFLRCEN